jgi:GT2 family glycosyltransferase
MADQTRDLLQDFVVVVLNHNGRRHLAQCTEAVLALDGLQGPESLVVVDNASRDGSLAWLEETHPRVRRLALSSNLGFAAGNNEAARRLDASWILFLNNDTRIEAEALVHLAQVAVAEGVDFVGARLLDWEGRRLDFDGGASSFTGHGHALGYSAFAKAETSLEARPTFFSSGAGLLARRNRFLELGGFAEDYFAYYEDLDLGWRIWQAGGAVMHAPRARIRHRHHGSAGHLPGGAQARLYERNALATVVRNYDDENLARVLPAALALAAHRAGGGDTRALLEGAVALQLRTSGASATKEEALDGNPAENEPVAEGSLVEVPASTPLPLPHPDWDGWPALAWLGLDWSALARSRSLVQAQRRVPDSQVLPRLMRPLEAVPASREAEEALSIAIEVFDLRSVFGEALDAPSPETEGFAEWGRLIRRCMEALREGGPAWLITEARGYLAWKSRRRGGRA